MALRREPGAQALRRTLRADQPGRPASGEPLPGAARDHDFGLLRGTAVAWRPAMTAA
jgi:hypothetical protein